MRSLQSRKQRQVRKIVELSFDHESISEFPHLQTEKANEKDTTKSVASAAKAKSTTSLHSCVNGVTKLGKELRALGVTRQ